MSAFRFIVLFCGRRWGKTRGAILWMVFRLYQRKAKLGWWVSPTYRQAKIAWKYFFILFNKSRIVVNKNRSDLTIDLVGGKRIEFRSSEIPDNLRGEGIDELVMDEFASQQPEVWHEILRPALMDSKGEVVFIGTPKGMNWATALFFKALSGDNKDWKAWRFSTHSNPFIDPQELKETEADSPEAVVRQEIYAEPLENASAVFRNIDDISTGKPEEPIKGVSYHGGVDLAKYRDFTVITMFKGRQQVYLERFNKIDWSLQEKRIQEVASRYNDAEMTVDSTGVGDRVFEELQRKRVRVVAFQISTSTKPELIDALSIRCDKRELVLLNDEVQKNELKAYAYELSKSMKLKTNAPAGMHDDTVISVALATFKDQVAATTRVITNRVRGYGRH